MVDNMATGKKDSWKVLAAKLQAVIKSHSKRLFGVGTNPRLTPYEASAGFTESSRRGAKPFQDEMGDCMEDVWDCSELYNKIPKGQEGMGGCDGYSDDMYYESKNRHDTMKQSMAFSEIKPKLEHAISSDKEFALLILVDKKTDRNVPLGDGSALTKIRGVKGYNPDIHRWVSGKEIYKLLFPSHNPTKVMDHILDCLRKESKKSRI